MSSQEIETLVVDANPLLSALMGGQAESILLSRKFAFVSTQFTLFEVQKYLPRVAARTGISLAELLDAYNLLPVVAHQPHVYDAHIDAAKGLIGARDEKDVPILALSLALAIPIWSDDRDFEGLAGVTVVKTSELLVRLGSPAP
jgi:predicted nucleic acid-binding protein